jgi:V8-like Glu-specific endopeptidase
MSWTSLRTARLLASAVLLAALPARADFAWQPLAAPHGPAVTAGADRAPIYNGTPTGDFPGVVGLVIQNTDGSSVLCSGSLVAPDVVLTAGHCLSFGPALGTSAYVFPDGVTPSQYLATAYSVHPDFSLARAAYADVGVLLLGNAVIDVAPVALASRSPRRRARGTIVGFGDDGAGGSGVKRVGTVRLRRCPRAIRRVGVLPGQLSTSVCWHAKRRGNDTCPGDSGGPLLVDGAVLGVTSGGYGVAPCPGKLSWNTDVTKVRDYIDAALAAAAS